MEKFYQFAGVEFSVEIPDEWMYESDRQLAAFRVEGCKDPHLFCFRLVSALDVPRGEQIAWEPGFRVFRNGAERLRYIGTVNESWESAYIRAAHNGRSHQIQLLCDRYAEKVGVHTVLTSLAAEHLVTEQGGFVFHSSYIAHNGGAILFTAPSGTGKSTQADLWHRFRGAEIINGDRSVVRNIGGKLWACGIPFAGSSAYCQNRTLPLTAVVYLSQAPQTTVTRLSGFRAFRSIWEGVSVNGWEPEDVAKVTDGVKNLVESVPVYHLACTPDVSAVEALETALRER